MTRDSFTSLLMRLEVAWSDKPEGLLKQTVCWVILGYITLLSIFCAGLLVAAGGVLIAVKFQGIAGTLLAGVVALAGLLTATFIFGCLWVRFDPPPGIPLSEEDHPDLHALIRETGARAGGIVFHRVIANAEMSASVVQNPRLGVLGWHRAYLVIGLPLMEALPVEELQAVLAHEFAHVAGKNGKTAAWLHRTRTTWERVAVHMSSARFCPFAAKFFNWFWPRLNSRACVLSRFNEQAADRTSADAVSCTALANGLRRLAIQGERLEDELWMPLERTRLGAGVLPDDVMERMSALLKTPPEAAKAEKWLQRALSKGSAESDRHPRLAARLASLEHGAAPGVLPGETAPSVSAAEELLRPAFLAKARAAFSREWLETSTRSRDAGEPGLRGREGIRSVKEAWDRIAALCRLDGLEKVQPEVLALLDRRPNHSGALYLRGCHLAGKGDPASMKILEQAAADPILSVRAYEAQARFHSQFGRTEETANLKERAARHERELRAALVERTQVTRDDCFLPHDLCPRELESLRQTLEGEPVVRRAWAGAKQVKHFPGWRHLVLVVEVRWPAFKPVTQRMQQELNARILENWEADGYVHVIPFDENNRPILRALRRGCADSTVYRRRGAGIRL